MRDKSDETDESGNRTDSIWAVIAGTIKSFRLPIDYVLYEMSYANLNLYGASLPSYHKPDGEAKQKKDKDIINASDPRNKNRVRDFLNSID